MRLREKIFRFAFVSLLLPILVVMVINIMGTPKLSIRNLERELLGEIYSVEADLPYALLPEEPTQFDPITLPLYTCTLFHSTSSKSNIVKRVITPESESPFSCKPKLYYIYRLREIII